MMSVCFIAIFFLMIPRPPDPTRTGPLFPYTTLVRSLLTQADIGAFAVMAVTAWAFRIIATAGLVQTIARKNQITPAFLDTIYRSQQAFSFLSALLIMALAQPIAGWMDAPDIALPLAVMRDRKSTRLNSSH